MPCKLHANKNRGAFISPIALHINTFREFVWEFILFLIQFDVNHKAESCEIKRIRLSVMSLFPAIIIHNLRNCTPVKLRKSTIIHLDFQQSKVLLGRFSPL